MQVLLYRYKSIHYEHLIYSEVMRGGVLEIGVCIYMHIKWNASISFLYVLMW